VHHLQSKERLMSSIPNSAMPHAKVHHDDDHKPKPPKPPKAAASDWVEDATDAARAGLATATDAVKSHPKTAIAVGATVIAGIAAAIAAPATRHPRPRPRYAGADRGRYGGFQPERRDLR